MKSSQNPFSVYDLLGYLIPGLLSILGTSLICQNQFQEGHLTETFWNSMNISAFNINQIIPLLIVAYLVGHLLSYLSAMTIEKFSIWSIGYPTQYLFEKILNKEQKNSNRFYEFLIHFFRPRIKPNLFIYLLRISLLLFLLPMVVPLIFASGLLNMHISIKKPLNKGLAKYCFKKIQRFYKSQKFKLDNEILLEFEWFRPLSHFVTENYPNHSQKIQNYVALYGFNRNISLMFISFFWFALAKGIYERQMSEYIFFLIGLMILSLIFYASFNKFFRRYSLEVIMAISTSCKTTEKSYI